MFQDMPAIADLVGLSGRAKLTAAGCPPGAPPSPSIAVGETVILRPPLSINVERPTKGRGGCSRMIVSPTATPQEGWHNTVVRETIMELQVHFQSLD